MSINLVTCSQADFVKHITQSNLNEAGFDNIIKTINENYVEIAEQISKLHEKRVDLLVKLRETHHEYKKIMGHGEIQKLNDAVDEDDSDVEKTKSTKRGKKKDKVDEEVKEVKELV